MVPSRDRQVRAAEESARALRQRVRDIAAIIGRDRIEEIEAAVRAVEERRSFYQDVKNVKQDLAWPPTPVHAAETKIARNLGSAIARLEKQLQVRNRRGVIARASHGYGEEYFAFEQQLKRWRERFEGWGGKRGRPGLFPAPGRRSVDQLMKRYAAEVGYALFSGHGLNPTMTPTSDYCRVAALLFGNKRADLSHQCRTIIESGAAAARRAQNRRHK